MHLKNADLISTSVGSKNLIHLRSIFAKLAKIEQKSKQIICFENGFRVSSNFKKVLKTVNFGNLLTQQLIKLPLVQRI